MIVFLSYFFAVMLTATLAVFLYPIAGFFWIIGLFGKISDVMFKFTSKTISRLWRDLRKINNDNGETDNTNKWKCPCGCMNIGNFCSECGAPMPQHRE